MLQSKRLILATLERRLRMRELESMRARVDRLRAETEKAHEQYCSSLLRWGTPETPDYWPVAYARLVETAERLSAKLRGAAVELRRRVASQRFSSSITTATPVGLSR